MNSKLLFAGILSMMAISCSIDEIAAPEETEGSKVFYAYIDDQPRDVDTKVQVTDLTSFNRIVWNVDDRITIFNKSTYNREFLYQGKDLDNKGSFKDLTPSDVFITGNSLGERIYAIYPYKEETGFDDVNDCITFEFPAVQNYLANSFSRGANTMVSYSPTGSTDLSFKNAGGYLSFKLWGDNVTVSSVILKGNGGELLAGTGTISIDSDGLPVVEMASGGKDEVSIWCEEPILLGSSAENYTEFCFVLPPVAFSAATNGFTLYVTTPDGKVFSRRAKMDLTIERNMMNRMDPLKVTPQTQSNSIAISKISSNAGGYGESVRKIKSSTNSIYTNTSDPIYYNEVTPDNNTFSITLPTVTDFSELYLNFYGLQSGDKLLVDGKEVAWSFVDGVAKGGPIDASGPSDDIYKPASKPVTLTVRRGYAEKRYTLDATNTGLPVVRIETDGFTQQDVDADTKEGEVDNRVWRGFKSGQTAKITIEYPNGTIDCDHLDFDIKGRGNATWKYNKRPYALKLAAESKVLGMKKHDRWILLANWKDRTLLRNDVSFWLSKQTGLNYTVDGKYVELVFNDVHRGNYYLCEQVKFNRVASKGSKKWKPTDTGPVTGGFMMEIDNNFDEQFKFPSEEFKLKYMFKDPDEELTQEAVDYMKGYINTLESKIKSASTSDYKNYFDIESAIWFMFVNELTGNGDFFNTDSDSGTTYYGPHSTYFYKEKDVVDEEGNTTERKLFMGPVWDFDYLTFVPSRKKGWGWNAVTEDRVTKWHGLDNQDYYYYYMCQDPDFTAMIRTLWDQFYGKVDTEFVEYVNMMVGKIRESEEFNTAMWGYKNTNQDQGQNGDNELDFEGENSAVKRLKDTFSSRLTWMDGQLRNFNGFGN